MASVQMSPSSSSSVPRNRTLSDSVDKGGSEDEEDSQGRPVVRKRKRLAKACDPCHKSKRRCDGKSPCGNCEFATKKCVYTDSMGRAVAAPHGRPEDLIALLFPRPAPQSPSRDSPSKRRHSASSQHSSDTPTSSQGRLKPRGDPEQADGDGSSNKGGLSPSRSEQQGLPWPGAQLLEPGLSLDRLSLTSPLHMDPDLKLELVNLFFAQSYPFNLIIHRPTFLGNLSLGSIPSYLLLCVFALAAPLSVHPALSNLPPWQHGELFADAARSLLLDQNGALMVPKSLEVTQALCFLQIHEVIMRRTSRSDGRYMTIALDVLREFGVHQVDQYPSDPPESAQDWLAKECYRRTFWLIYVIELLSSAFTDRPMSFRENELMLYLPMPESLFEMTVSAGPPTDFLHPGTPGLAAPAEFGNLIRVTSIYARIMGHLHENAGILHNPERQAGLAVVLHDCETALHAWQVSLPPKLKFNETNLRLQMTTFQMVGGPGWCFAFMHALSECAMLALYEYFDKPPGKRSHDVVSNLTVILEALDKKGRSSIMMATLLLAIAKHSLNVRVELDARIATWCGEYQHLWGVSIANITSLSFRQDWVGPRAQVPELIATQRAGQLLNEMRLPGGPPIAPSGPTSNGLFAFSVPPPPALPNHPISYAGAIYSATPMNPSTVNGLRPGFSVGPPHHLRPPGPHHLPGGPFVSAPTVLAPQPPPFLPPPRSRPPYLGPGGPQRDFLFPAAPYQGNNIQKPVVVPSPRQAPYLPSDASRLRTPGLHVGALTGSTSSSSPSTDRLPSLSPSGDQAPGKRAPVGLGWLADELSASTSPNTSSSAIGQGSL